MMVWRDGSDDSYPVGPRLRDAGTLAELIGLVIVFQLSAGWHLLESLIDNHNPEFFGVRQYLEWVIFGCLFRGLIPSVPAKAAPPKSLGFFYGQMHRSTGGHNSQGSRRQGNWSLPKDRKMQATRSRGATFKKRSQQTFKGVA